MSEPIKKVLANVAQNLSNAEKAQARENIGAAGAGDVPANAVLYTAQTLQDYEKAQARQNINAATGDVATTSSNGLMSSTDKTKLDGIAAGAEVNVQSDWNQTNNAADDYIKNKPFIPEDKVYVFDSNSFNRNTVKAAFDAGKLVYCNTTFPPDYSKVVRVQLAGYDDTTIDGVGYEVYWFSGSVPKYDAASEQYGEAQFNIPAEFFYYNKSTGEVTRSGTTSWQLRQPDWNQSDNTADDYIKNKPSIPGAQVNSDWNASSGVAQILNKPSLTNTPYGGSATSLSSLNFDFDDPEGYVEVKVNGGYAGNLVAGPYKGLLDSGINNGSGVGDSNTPIYIDTDGTFKSGSSAVAFVSTSSSYAQVLALLGAGKEVILKVDVSSDLSQYFSLAQTNPDGSMEFTCVRGGSSVAAIYKYSLNTSSQWTRTDLGVGNYSGTAPVTVNNWAIGLADGGITYKKISNTMWRKLTASRYNEAYTEPSHTQIIRGSTSDAGRILAYVWDEKKNDQFYMTRSTEQGYASQYIHIDFSCDVRPYSSSYDPTNDTKFNIALVCQNAGGSYAYLINSEQVQRFNMGTNFSGIHQIHASFDIESDQMSHSYDSNDPELCVIFSARTNINPAWYDTVDGLVFENQRITGFCWGHP